LTIQPGADPVKLADQLMKLLGPKKFAGLHQARGKLLPDRPANSKETKGKAAGAAPKKTRPAAAGD
jgi:hypothetical protein